METKHTATLWALDSFRGTGGWQICTISSAESPGLIADGVRIANAQRIIACVNACAEFADPAAAIRDNFAFGTDMAKTVDALRAQRDELKEALERCLTHFERIRDQQACPHDSPLMSQIRAALAKVQK